MQFLLQEIVLITLIYRLLIFIQYKYIIKNKIYIYQ